MCEEVSRNWKPCGFFFCIQFLAPWHLNRKIEKPEWKVWCNEIHSSNSLARRPFSLGSTRPPFRKTIPTLLLEENFYSWVTFLHNTLPKECDGMRNDSSHTCLRQEQLLLNHSLSLVLFLYISIRNRSDRKEDETVLDETETLQLSGFPVCLFSKVFWG